MKRIKTLVLITSILIFALSSTLVYAGQKWHKSYDKVLKKAEKTGKVVLANFTGSDWCGWCMKMEKEIFDTETFEKWAEDKVLLLEIDFPASKKQSREIEKQNKRLKNKYQIKGFPTLLFIDHNGKMLGKGGYIKGDAEKWVKIADDFLDSIDRGKIFQPETNFQKIKKLSSSKNIPILAILEKNNSAEESDLKPLFRNPDFKMLADKFLKVVYLNETDIQKTESRKFFNKFQPVAGKIKFVLINSAEGKTLGEWEDSGSVDFLLKNIKNAVPIDYQNGKWLKDFEKARIIAEKKNKKILANFTGSDWCGWCKKFHKEVFSKDKFIDYSKDKYVLVKVDFPVKNKIPENLREINQNLAEIYSVQGYPTILVLTPEGEELARFGYVAGGVNSFIDKLESI